MGLEKKHYELIVGLHSQLKKLFDSSEQAIYLYLNDLHRICNKKFASLLGYDSPSEWEKIVFSEALADRESLQAATNAYQNVTEKMIGSMIDVKWRTRSGEIVDTTVIMVPIIFKDYLFALNFISKKK